MKIAIYPGSFDPITTGHLNIIERAAKIFDRLIVCTMVNAGKRSPTTMPPMMDTDWPTLWGRWTPDSCSSSKASSSARTSTAVEKGTACSESIWRHIEESEGIMAEGFTADELEQFRGYLRRAISNLEQSSGKTTVTERSKQ